MLLNSSRKKTLRDNNKDISYTAYEIDLNQKGYHQWVGGQVHNDVLYAIPNHETKILKYHLESGEEEYVLGISEGKYKWTGGTVYKNVLYGFPRSSNNLLSLDLMSGVVKEIPLTCNYDSEHHYGGVCTKTGIVYQPPRNNNHILRIDLKTKVCKKIFIKGLNENSRYCGSIIHPDGNVYFFPEHMERVLKLDIQTEKYSFIGEEISPMCFEAKVAMDGCIYGFSAYNMGMLKIDVQKETSEILYPDTYFGSYGTKMGVNRKLYSVPGDGQFVWEYDSANNILKKICDLKDSTKAKFAGGAVDDNGRIFLIPADAGRILVYEPSDIEKINGLSILFEDFY